MRISTVNYLENFLPKLDLTRILGILTNDALHQLQLELKINAISVQSKLGEGTHIHLGLFMTNTKYATLSPVTYVRPMHLDILQITNTATGVASYELKRVYGKNLPFLHEVNGYEQELIQHVITAVNKKCMISMKNRTTGQFTGNMSQIFAYLLSTYGKISPSHLKFLKKK